VRFALGGTERIYAATVLLLGVLFALVLPPMQGPDEVAHFVRAYGIGEGLCIAPSTIRVPQSYLDEASKRFRPLTADDPEVAEGRLRSAIVSSLRVPASDADFEQPSMFLIDVYPCVLYAPAAFALAVTHVFHPSLPVALLFARLATLVACLALMLAGYRLAPFGKPLFVFVTLLPMFVAQSAVVSADALADALAPFAVAALLRLRFGDPERQLTRAELVGLAALAVALALAKLDGALLLLFLLIPAARFGGTPRKYGTIAAFGALGLAVSFAWSALNRDLARYVIGLQLSDRNVDVAYNVHYVVSRPAETALIFWNAGRAHGADWITTTAGTFGWAVAPLPAWSVGVAIAVLIYLSIRVPARNRLGRRSRALLVVTALGGVVVALVGTFAYALTRGQLAQPASSIALVGVQGRYFLPFLIPLGLAAGSASNGTEEADTYLAIGAGALLNVIALVTIAQYFYR